MEDSSRKKISLINVAWKSLILFLTLNILFAFISPLPGLGKITGYNLIFPGRVRLPYGEISEQAYNLSLYNLDAMFASHELAGNNHIPDEYRVLLIGDSSVWGYLLKPNETLSAFINEARVQVSDNRLIRAYNLGYPTMSLVKDLLILNNSLRYKPDMIIWLVTLESFPIDKQLDSPIVQNNPDDVLELINDNALQLDSHDSRLIDPTFLESSLIGQRRAIADIFKLQLYGIMWASTGIDQYYPASYPPPQEDLEPVETFHNYMPGKMSLESLSFDAISAGNRIAGSIPIIIINEPIYLSHGENSDIRYNFFYPRWAFDQYRQLLSQVCKEKNWQCHDFWNLVKPEEFTNSAIHMSPRGTQQLATEIMNIILAQIQ